MTLEEERLYNKNAECALKSSGFELISTSPEDDYIEAYCPKCKSITVFHQDELDRARCYTCLDRLMYVQSQFVFEKKSRDSIEHSGFILEEMNYDEDFLMIRCPICGECSSYFRWMPSKTACCDTPDSNCSRTDVTASYSREVRGICARPARRICVRSAVTAAAASMAETNISP